MLSAFPLFFSLRLSLFNTTAWSSALRASLQFSCLCSGGIALLLLGSGGAISGF